MDIAKIRRLVSECFPADERDALSREAPGETELVMRALRSLFEQEMAAITPSRQTTKAETARHDRPH